MDSWLQKISEKKAEIEDNADTARQTKRWSWLLSLVGTTCQSPFPAEPVTGSSELTYAVALLI